MKLRQLKEKRYQAPDIGELLENPTARELLGFYRRKGELRGLVAGSDCFFWESYTIIHEEAYDTIKSMGLTESPFDKCYRLYVESAQATSHMWGKPQPVGPLAFITFSNWNDRADVAPQAIAQNSENFSLLLQGLGSMKITANEGLENYLTPKAKRLADLQRILISGGFMGRIYSREYLDAWARYRRVSQYSDYLYKLYREALRLNAQARETVGRQLNTTIKPLDSEMVLGHMLQVYNSPLRDLYDRVPVK